MGNKIDSRQAAKDIIAKAGVVKERVELLKTDAEELLKFVMIELKNTTGSIPDKDAFLDIVAKLIDELVALPFPLEQMDDFLILKLLKILDKSVFGRFWGNDWFEKLQEKAEKI